MKHFLLYADMHEPRKDKYTTLLENSYENLYKLFLVILAAISARWLWWLKKFLLWCGMFLWYKHLLFLPMILISLPLSTLYISTHRMLLQFGFQKTNTE